MTRARITAAQATRPPKGMRMHRGTVTVVSPLTVQIAGGGAVTGLAVPGHRYTVGDAVLVAVQEPAVGPVYPLAPTPAPDLAPYAKTADLPATTTGTIAYGGTGSAWGSGPSVLLRYGPLVSLKLQVNVGATPPAIGATIAILPAGYRPASAIYARAILWLGAWGKESADLAVNTDGTIFVGSASTAIAANAGIFLSVTYPAA